MITVSRSLFLAGCMVTVVGCSQNMFQKEEVIIVSVPKPATYCYRSLANVDCYEEPVPERERTLLIPVD